MKTLNTSVQAGQTKHPKLQVNITAKTILIHSKSIIIVPCII